MLTAIVCVLGFVIIGAAVNNGEWGVVVTFLVIGVILLLMISGGKKCDRAYGNFVDYWAKGGPDRKK